MPRDEILYMNLKSPVGDMIAGATEKGVCFLEWHSRGGVDRIKSRIEKRYQLPLKEEKNKHLSILEGELQSYFGKKLKTFSVSLDIKGTKFEELIWSKLLGIPFGTTKSYGQIAELAGNKSASRAVGRANGSNYISILIPCHRVIEANGNLRGYGGGLDRKQFLLELESADFNPLEQ